MAKVHFVPDGLIRVGVQLGGHVGVNMSNCRIGEFSNNEQFLQQVRYSCFVMKNFQTNESSWKTYSYYAPVDMGLALGDIVLCETCYGICLGKIIDIPETESGYTGSMKNIIQKLNFDHVILDKVKELRITEVKRKLNDLRRKMEDRLFYEMLAEKLPEAEDLIKELKDLGGM